MKNKVGVFVLIIALIGISGFGQVTRETLEMEWEASVNYGNSGQTTVFVNDTLWHFGGQFFYGTPLGVEYWEYSYVEYMALSNNYWVIDTTKTIYRANGNAEVSGDYIYLFGGHSTQPEAMEIFHPASRTITRAADLPNPRRYGGSAIYEGKIYLVGGADIDGYKDLVDIYDIASDTWSSGAPMPIATQTDVVVKNGKIYTFGGYNGAPRNEIYEYDIAMNTWNQTGFMPEPTSAHSVAVYDDYVYVFGDYTELSRIMRYTISDSSWVEYDSNLIGRRHASVTIANDKLYYVGGNASRANGTYQRFRVVQSIDLSGVVSTSSNGMAIPKTLELVQNTPNPFNPSTTIQFKLNEPTRLSVTIYNVQGQVVRRLTDSYYGTGSQEVRWDGKNDQGEQLSSGQYIYALNTETDVLARKMILLR